MRLTQRDTAEVKDFSEFFKIDYGITDYRITGRAKKLMAFVEQLLCREELVIAAVKVSLDNDHRYTPHGIILRHGVGADVEAAY